MVQIKISYELEPNERIEQENAEYLCSTNTKIITVLLQRYSTTTTEMSFTKDDDDYSEIDLSFCQISKDKLMAPFFDDPGGATGYLGAPPLLRYIMIPDPQKVTLSYY
jgi:hypothetical protein